MADKNGASMRRPLWGVKRIGDTLRLLGYDPPGEDSIRKYMIKPVNPHEDSSSWLSFLRNHLNVC